MPDTTSTTLDGKLIQDRILPTALLAAAKGGIVKPLVTEVPMEGGTLILNEIEGLVATAQPEGVPPANTQQATYNKATVVSGQKTVKVHLTRQAIRRARNNMFDLVDIQAQLMGQAIADVVDESIVDLFPLFTTVTVSHAGATHRTIYHRNAIAKLAAQGIPAPSLRCVLHPAQAEDLFNDYNNPSTTRRPTDDNDPFLEGRINGVPVYASALVDLTGSDAYGLMFDPFAIVYGVEEDIYIDQVWNYEKNGLDLYARIEYGVAIWSQKRGCSILTDATL